MKGASNPANFKWVPALLILPLSLPLGKGIKTAVARVAADGANVIGMAGTSSVPGTMQLSWAWSCAPTPLGIW